MKSDLDALMQANGLDAILVTGPAQHNPTMTYFTGLIHLSQGELIKPRGRGAKLFYGPMERDEAASTGLDTKNLFDYPFKELLKETDGDRIKALALRFKRMFTDAGVTQGRVALYGTSDVGASYAIFNALQDLMPELELVGELEDSVLLDAMATKDEAEAEEMRKISRINMEVVGEVQDFLASHRVKDGVLVKADGQPLQIAEVKARINLWLAERGAENPHGTIFAIGRDAGVPHSAGTPTDVLKLGETIVFDIYPAQQGGGYHSDFTRTWCLGYAPDEALALYEDVWAVFQEVMAALKAGEDCPQYQDLTCELFEARGHATIGQDMNIQEGYVHSIGHGLGLFVHERPWFRKQGDSADKLDPGVVVTIEPGLYYPSKNLGCRIEDAVYVTPSGDMEILTKYPYDLVVPVKA